MYKMKKIIVFILLLICISQIGMSQKTDKSLVSAKVQCGPWLQAVGENEFTVVWTTSVESVVWVELAPDDGSHFYAKERPKYYQSVDGRRPISKLHQVRITGLEPGTIYRYRIYQQALLSDEGNKRVVFGEAFGNDILKREPYRIKTLDKKSDRCRFSVVNDIHENDSLFQKLMKGMLDKNNDFMVFNGDMLTQIESRSQIENYYMKSASKIFSGNMPIYAVRGNHEFRGSASYDFMKLFPSSTGLPYYTVRQGPAFIIFMDSGEDKPDSDIRFYGLSLTDQMRVQEAIWLKKVVESEEFKQAPVKIVVIHMPPMPNGWYGVREVDRLFTPILNDAGIDFMLCGHLHKLQYIKEGKDNNQFPILINSNKYRVDMDIDNKKIDIRVVDEKDLIVDKYSILK